MWRGRGEKGITTSQVKPYYRIFRNARLVWVWTHDPFDIDGPNRRTPRDIREALAEVDANDGYRLGVDARHATISGAMRELDPTWFERPEHPRVRQVAFVAKSTQDAGKVNVAVPLVGTWLSAELRVFADLRQALNWLEVAEKVSEDELAWPGEGLITEQPRPDAGVGSSAGTSAPLTRTDALKPREHRDGRT